jgi:hypothetical protein
MPETPDSKKTGRPKDGDAIISVLEPSGSLAAYIVKVCGDPSQRFPFEGRDTWTRAYQKAKQLAGPGHSVWRQGTDGTLSIVP